MPKRSHQSIKGSLKFRIFWTFLCSAFPIGVQIEHQLVSRLATRSFEVCSRWEGGKYRNCKH